MSDPLVLLAACKALIPTSWPLHDGEVTASTPTVPWVVWSASVPGGQHRADAGVAVAGDLVLTVRVAASSQHNTNLILGQVVAAIDGARPTAEGWACGSMQPYQPPRTDPADLIIAGASAHLWQGIASWKCTVSPLT